MSTSIIGELREKSDSPRLRRLPSPRLVSLKRGRPEVLAEDLFRRVLSWERKKAERWGRSLLLMLVDVKSLLETNQSEKALPEIVSALASSTRETDLSGWFQERTILGVIFGEINKTASSAAESLLRAKVTRALRASLGAERADQIHLSFHIFPKDCDLGNSRRLIDAAFYPDLLERDKSQKLPNSVKRSIDIVGSLLALALSSPLWAALALAIKLTSKGPILFRQERVGRYGRRFMCLKFRSMKWSNDPGIHKEYVRRFITGEIDPSHSGGNQKVVCKIQDDPRVTRVGKFLRRTSLDELPQFINVLKGEMSLVGPRPPIPYELEAYRPWHWRRVHEAMPGITGLWQVNGRSRLKFDDMVRLDIRYAKTWSLWTDIKILLRTPRAVIRCEGAY